MITRTTFATVPRLFAGQTIACLGTGPSLCLEDVERLFRAGARLIAVNDAYTLAPTWMAALYAADAKWWRWHRGAPSCPGLKYTIEPQPDTWPELQVLRNTGREGLESDPSGLRTGHNSGYQAINLAVHLGAARIVLLGYDLQGRHFFGEHPDRTVPPFQAARRAFETLVAPLAAIGVPIVNCSRATTLTAFPRETLATALLEVAA